MTDQAESTHSNPPDPAGSQRVQEARKRLMELAEAPAQGDPSRWVPAWSSLLLEQTLDRMLTAPGWRIRDVLGGLWEVLARTECPLTKTVSHFIKDIVIHCFTRYRSRYESEEFRWMEVLLNRSRSQAQAYLALHALPEPEAIRCRHLILGALQASDYFDEANRSLSD